MDSAFAARTLSSHTVLADSLTYYVLVPSDFAFFAFGLNRISSSFVVHPLACGTVGARGHPGRRHPFAERAVLANSLRDHILVLAWST